MNKPFDMEIFLAGVLTGAHATRVRHIHQAKTTQAAISERWNRDNPWTWQKTSHMVLEPKREVSRLCNALLLRPHRTAGRSQARKALV